MVCLIVSVHDLFPKDISFIVVSWNAKKYLIECLQSLIKESTGFQAEIIVVDNGSEDGSPGYVREQFPEVVLVENRENLGFAKANNIGIRRSKGKYIFLVNSDIKVLEGCIHTMICYMEKHPEVAVLGPQILNADLTIQPSCKSFPTIWKSFCRTFALDSLFPKWEFFSSEFMGLSRHDAMRRVDILVGCFWLVRRNAIENVGLLDERFFIYSEDKDWCKRFHQADWEVIYFPEAKAIHYGGASSENAPIRFYIEMQKANLQYWEKHHNILEIIIFRNMLYLNNIFRIIVYILLKRLHMEDNNKISEKIERSRVFLRWMYDGKIETEV